MDKDSVVLEEELVFCFGHVLRCFAESQNGV